MRKAKPETKLTASAYAALESELESANSLAEALSALQRLCWSDDNAGAILPPGQMLSPEALAAEIEVDRRENFESGFYMLFDAVLAVTKRESREAAYADWEPAVTAAALRDAVGHGSQETVDLSILDFASSVWRVAVRETGEWMKHPAAALIRKAWKRPAEGDARRVDFVEALGLRMSKVPGLANLAHQSPLEAGEVVTIEVDGERFASPGPVSVRRYRAQRTAGQIDAFPAKIDGRATGGLLVEALADLELTGDERSRLRRDLRGFGELVCALARPMRATAGEIMAIMGWPGGATVNNIPRVDQLLLAARHLRVDLGDGLSRWLFDLNAIDQSLSLDTRYKIAAGEWWQGGSRAGEGNAWRLSGGLWRPMQGPGGGQPGSLGIGYWGLPDRILSGIEAALSWSSSPGKGRGGRTPDALRPERAGGPGPERIIPAWHVLRLAGENVTADQYRSESAHSHRYRGALQTLQAMGYFCAPGGTAEAGGTIEIIRAVKGGNGREAALVVRASARFCEAYEKGQKASAWSSAPISDIVVRRAPTA